MLTYADVCWDCIGKRFGNVFIMLTYADVCWDCTGKRFGNVFIGVQPSFGYEGDPMRLLFSRSASPHHGTQFTRFTGTKVQVLTPEKRCAACFAACHIY